MHSESFLEHPAVLGALVSKKPPGFFKNPGDFSAYAVFINGHITDSTHVKVLTEN